MEKDQPEDGTAGDRPRGIANDEQRCPKMQEISLNCCKVRDVEREGDGGEEPCGDARW